METLKAIHTRQSIPKVLPDPVPHELVKKILAAGAQAPNHHKVRPWRFFIVEGEARYKLGEVMAQALSQRDPAALPEALIVERARPLRAPLVIAVGVDKPGILKVLQVENICAAAAAVQNMLLAAHDLGLAAMWRTGPAAEDPTVKRFFGLEPDQPLIAFVYIGYPESERIPVERLSFEDRTFWV
jgi:nitroreductase